MLKEDEQEKLNDRKKIIDGLIPSVSCNKIYIWIHKDVEEDG